MKSRYMLAASKVLVFSSHSSLLLPRLLHGVIGGCHSTAPLPVVAEAPLWVVSLSFWVRSGLSGFTLNVQLSLCIFTF